MINMTIKNKTRRMIEETRSRIKRNILMMKRRIESKRSIQSPLHLRRR
jgi:hypothetical protein